MTILEMAEKLGGTLEGDGSAELSGVGSLDDAAAGEISFLANPRYAAAVSATAASAVIVAEDWAGNAPCAVIRVSSPDGAFAMAADLLAPPAVKPAAGVHPSAVVPQDVTLGDGVSIGPYVVLESGVTVGNNSILEAFCFLGVGTKVGSDCHLYPHVTTREYTIIGNSVTIHNGAVLGSDGFGYVPGKDGSWSKIAQRGQVVVGDDVEIGANTTIDRARFGKTTIESGVKIDNLVQIAHNVTIGENSAIAAQVGISGSTAVGPRVRIGGQAGFSGHLTVGADTQVGGQAGVIKSVPPGSSVAGFPALPQQKFAKLRAHLLRLPQLKARLQELEAQVAELEAAKRKEEAV